MRNNLLKVLISFITGASLTNAGILESHVETNLHINVVEAPPQVVTQKLTPAQLKEVLDLKLQGIDAYVVTVKNPSRRTYSLSTSSINADVFRYNEAVKILEKKGSPLVSGGFSVAGTFFWPLGVIGNIYSLGTLKKAKIFEGKLKAMLLDKEVVPSYGELSRLVLVKKDQNLSKADIDLIDMQTSQIKKVQVS
jgi:hypothetical protein